MRSLIKKELLVVLIILLVSTKASLVDDFVESAKNFWPKSRDVSSERRLPSISFELPSENEVFLKEGLALIDIPRNEMDLCTHRVVTTLKTNCNKLTLEEIGKLAVMLMNCQLEIEGRDIYPCRPEMSLQQCTVGMDSNMYTVYNFMTHRAVGICSAIKSDQFRALTEITVNRLNQATQAQLLAVQESLKNQQKANEMGIQHIKDFLENEEKIKNSQADSVDKLKLTGSLIEENLSILQQEFELRQRSEEKLSDIEKSASEISSKLEQQSASLQKNNLELLQQYNQTLEFINNLKTIIQVIVNIVESIRIYSEKFVEVAHETGLELSSELIAFFIVNLAYFTSVMVFMLFIGATWTSRTLLILLFTFNFIAALFRVNVELLSLNTLVWITLLAVKAIGVLKRQIEGRKFEVPNFLKFRKDEFDNGDEQEKTPARERSLTPFLELLNSNRDSPTKTNNIRIAPFAVDPFTKKAMSKGFINAREEDSEVSQFFHTASSINITQTPSTTPVNISMDRPLTPAMRRVMNESYIVPDRSGTPFMPGMVGRTPCQALTAKRLPCKNAAVPEKNKCRVHSN